MDEVGSNVECIGHLNLGMALHPVILKDGRIMFSSLESQGLRSHHLWGVWSINPDGTRWGPIVSAFEIEPEDLDAAFARMVLSAVVERFAARGLVVATLVLIGHRAEVICDYASSHGFELILIGSSGPSRTGVGLAEAVRRRAPITVESVA